MDEEEYQEEEQSDSKINLGSFFERVDSVEKVASSALSKANANFGIINAQKTLINSINISIEALETKVRDVANYIIIEKKITKDEEADRLVEERDKEQKNITAERLMGLKGDPGEKGDPGQPAEPEQGGGGGGILGTLLKLGIGVFAVKFLWPALLPLAGGLLKGALAKFAIFSIGGIGSIIKGLLVGSGLTGIGFGIGALVKKLADAAKNRSDKVAESAAKAVKNFSFGKDGKVDGPDSLNVEGGSEGGTEGGEEKEMSNLGPDYKKQEEDAFKAAEDFKVEKSNLNLEENSAVNDMDKTLEKKDLKKKKIYIVRGTSMKFDTRDEAVRWILNYIETKKKPEYEESVKSESGVDIDTQDNYEKWLKIFGQYVKLVQEDRQSITNDEVKRINKIYVDFKDISPYGFDNEKSDKVDPSQSKELEKAITPNVENKNVDLSLSDSFAEDIGISDSQFLSELVNTDPTGNLNKNTGQIVNTPYNLPNTTETTVKFTDMKVPFLKSLSNQYLSISGKTIPPEYYRAFK